MVLNVCIIHGRLRSWQGSTLKEASGHGRCSWDTLTSARVSLTSAVPPFWIITGLSLQLTVLKVNLKKGLQLTSMSLLVGT